jgi:hypothetical protein
MGTGRSGKGVKNEAKAAAGVAEVNGLGMGREDGATVEGTGGKNSVSRQGVTHHAGERLRGVVEVRVEGKLYQVTLL